ncbi:hypothetical protein [Dyella nitratireducens]|uniref:Core-binding (CB) domain-containing protein n=1 Tax=Dyella nitratireducens TaxID=1849580 RepID=A0ABQ1GWC2_9GAMM|nr:hypothetical protein GCM10010981_45900 [Dyella nitratireducens]GLQ41717.1 hypothetical protein GCM10007902_15670 [Dyella nitratireducens]
MDQALQGIQSGRDYTVELPNGTKLKTDSLDADHRHAQDVILALTRAGALSPLPTTISIPATPKVGLLSERIEKFLSQMKVQERSETNHFDTAFTLKVFLGLVGDKDLSEVSPDDLDIFMDGLAHWPANASKKKPYKGLSPKEVLKKAKQRQDKGLTPCTKEKHLDCLRLFFNNCVERRLISYNPCKGRVQHLQVRHADVAALLRQAVFDPLKLFFRDFHRPSIRSDADSVNTP